MRLVKYFILLLISLTFCLYIFRLPLVETIITKGLIRSRADNIHLQLTELGMSRSSIKYLKTNFTLEDGKTITLALKNVAFEYSLHQMLSTGKCRKVTIEQLEVKQQDSTLKSKKTFQLPTEMSFGSNTLRQKIPLQEIHINNLLLTGDWPEQIKEKDITLEAFLNNNTLSAGLSIQFNKEIQLLAKAVSNNGHHIDLLLTAQKDQHHFLHNTFLFNKNIISGTVDMQLSPLRAVLLNQTTLSLPPVTGQLSGNFSLPFPLQHDSQIQTNLRLNDARGYTVTLKAQGDPVAKQLKLSLKGNNPQLFFATTLEMNGKQVNGKYQLKADTLRNFFEPYFSAQIPAVNGQLSGTFSMPFPLTDSGDFALTTEAQDLQSPWISGTFIHLTAKGKKTGNEITLDDSSMLQAADLKYGKYTAKKLLLEIGGRLTNNDHSMLLLFNANQRIELTHITLGKIRLDKIHGQSNKELRINLDHNSWTLAPTAFTFNDVQVSEPQRSYSFADLQIKIRKFEHRDASLQLITAVSTPMVKYHDSQRTVPLKNISCLLELYNNRLSANLQFSPESIPGELQLAVKHNLSTAAGNLRLRTTKRLDFDPDGVTLAQLYSPWKFPFTLDKGKVAVRATGKWAKKKSFQLASFVSVTGGEGVYKKFLFKGLNVRQDLAVLPRLYSKSEGNFSLQHLVGAIDITDIKSKLNFARSPRGKKPQIRITDFEASLFDGRISCPQIIYDQNHPDTTLKIALKNIDLEQVIALLKMNNLQVTGKIGGTLPVTLKGKEISMKKGILLNEPPGGEIHYTAVGIDTTSITGYALKAVENFQYNSLQATANYLPSGQLALDISLQGHSPSLETKRPVHFNIHAEQNLPALMQSLRFSKGITDELDRRVQKRYQ